MNLLTRGKRSIYLLLIASLLILSLAVPGFASDPSPEGGKNLTEHSPTLIQPEDQAADYQTLDEKGTQYTLSISIKGQGKTSIPAGERRFPAGIEMDIQSEPDSGWEFLYWRSDYPELEYNPSPFIHFVLEQDCSLKAVFIPSPGYGYPSQPSETNPLNPGLSKNATTTTILPTPTPSPTSTVSPGGSISGSVKDNNGTPIEGAELISELTGSGSNRWGYATSDQNGNYTISHLPSGNFRLSIGADGYIFEYYDGTFVEEEATLVQVTAPQNTPDINFTLDTAGSISGHVFKPDNTTGIAGAHIDAYLTGSDFNYSGSAHTNSEGSYTISGLQPGNYTLYVYSQGYVSEYYNDTYDRDKAALVSVQGGKDTPNINFSLSTGGSISGYVFNADNSTPVAGADLFAYQTDSSFGCFGSTHSNPDGSFTISVLGPGYYLLRTSADGYVTEYYDGTYNEDEATLISVEDSKNTSDINFTLDSGGSISGYVFQADNNTPIEDALIYAYLTGSNFNYSCIAYSNTDGNYFISGLPPGSYRLRTQANGYITEYYDGTYTSNKAALVSVQDEKDTQDINFSLETGGSISGFIFESDATTPIEDARISAQLIGSDFYHYSNSYSNPDGSYIISALPPGNYKVETVADGCITEFYDGVYDWDEAALVSVEDDKDTQDINFSMDTGGSISGFVFESDATTPIEGVRISALLLEPDFSYFRDSYSNPDGSYTISALPPGSYTVDAEANGYLYEIYDGVYNWDEAALVSVEDANDTPDINFSLKTSGSISGYVFNSDNSTAIKDAFIYAELMGSDFEYYAYSSSKSDGSYTISALPPGNYSLRAKADRYITEYYDGVYDWDEATLVSIEDANNTPDINFSLSTGGSISGYVFNSDNSTAIKDAIVYAEPIGSTFNYYGNAHSNTDGSYSIFGLPSGSYKLRTQADGYITEYYNGVYDWDEAALVSIEDDNDTQGINFTLDTGGSISGHVFKSDNSTAVENAWISVILIGSSLDHSGGAYSNPDGTYTISALPSGNYRLRTGADGYISEYYDGTCDQDEATLVCVMESKDTPEINITLDTGGSISGNVEDNCGNAIEYACICATLINSNFEYSDETYSDSDGSYSFSSLPPGDYELRVGADGYLDEYYNGEYDPDEATPVTVSAGEDTTDINFSLETGGSISGFVFEFDKVTPVKDAWIYATLINSDFEYSNDTCSDSDGSYSFSFLYPGDYLLEIEADEYLDEYYDGAYYSDEATPVTVSASEDTSDINFTLDEFGSISGFVFESDQNTPVEGALICITPLNSDSDYYDETCSDSDGSYSFSFLYPGDYRLEIEADGYISEYYDETYDEDEAAPVTVSSGEDTPDINFTLDTGGSISGYVFQSDNETAIENAWIYAKLLGSDFGYYGEGYSNPDGSYTIFALPPGDYSLRTKANGYITEYYDGTYDYDEATLVSVEDGINTPYINFTLDTGGSISGYVFNSDNSTAVEGAYIDASLTGSSFSYYRTAYSKPDGSYIIFGLPSGDYRLRAQAGGYISEYYEGSYDYDEATLVPVIDSETTPSINFTLDTGGTISGYVLESDNSTAIEDARIYAELTGSTFSYSRGANSNPDGSYSISGLPSGNYYVTADSNGYISEYYNGTYDQDEATLVSVENDKVTPDIDFILEKGGSISGFVFKSDNTTAIEGAEISASLTDSDLGYSGSAYSNLDGSYTISTLVPGNYRLSIKAEGYIAESYATLVPVKDHEDTSDISFSLNAGGSISGNVFKSDSSNAVGGAYIHAVLADSSIGYSGSAYSNPDGSYTISSLPSGYYRLNIKADGYITEYYDGTHNSAEAFLVSVTAPENTPNIDFTLDTGGSISGYIFKSDNSTAIKGAYIYATLTGSNFNYSGSDYSNPDGSYTIKALPPGNYRLRTSVDGIFGEYYDSTYDSNKATLVSVEDGINTPCINFTLDTGGSISGYIFNEDNTTAVGDASIYAQLTGDNFSYYEHTFSNPDGSYTIKTLPSGSYRISVSADDYVSEYYDGALVDDEAALVNVTDSKDTPEINFTLDTGGSISGYVFNEDNITAVEDARIYAQLIESNFSYSESAYSKPDGSYTIKALPSGSYRISVSADDYVSEYYDSALVAEEATLVSVNDSEDTPDINFTLDTGGSISGFVFSEYSASAIKNAYLYADLIGSKFSYSGTAYSNPDGSYTIKALPSGNYRVRATADQFFEEYYTDVNYPFMATPVSVTDGSITRNINFPLDPTSTSASISGLVFESDNFTRVRQAQIFVYDSVTLLPVGVYSIRDGFYYFKLREGSYFLQLNLFADRMTGMPETDFISEWYNNAFRKDKAALIVISAGESKNLNFTLDRGGTISGCVYQSDGITPTSAIVEVFEPDSSIICARTYTDDGNYKVGGLPSGTYLIRARRAGRAGWYPDVSSRSQAVEVPVTLLNDTPNTDIVLVDDSSTLGLLNTQPGSNAKNVPTNSAIKMIFNNPINSSIDVLRMEETRLNRFFIISPPTPGSFSWTDDSVIFTPSQTLKFNQTYTIYLSREINDIYGSSLDQGYSWSFTTRKKSSGGGSGDGSGDGSPNTTPTTTVTVTPVPATTTVVPAKTEAPVSTTSPKPTVAEVAVTTQPAISENPVLSPDAPHSTSLSETPKPEDNKGVSVWLWIVFVVLFLAGVVTGILIFRRKYGK